MGAPPGALPPPPPPPYYAPPYPGQMTPVGPPLGSPPTGYRYGPPARELIRKIGDGVRWYLVTLVLSLLSAIGSAVLTGYVVSSAFGLGGSSLPSAGLSASSTALAIGLGVLGLLVFVLTIVAWLSWRSGVRQLPAAAMEFGSAYATSAQSALKDYGRTVWSFLSILIGTVVFAIVLAAYIVSQAFAHCSGPLQSNNTSCVTSGASTLSNTVGIVLVFGLIVALLQFLQYFFASRSLVDSIRPLVAEPQQQRLDRGRLFMVIGAGLTPVGLINAALLLGNHAVPVLGFVGLLTPILLLLGLYQIHEVYVGWNSASPQGGAPSGGYPAYQPPMAAPYGAPTPPAYFPPR
ncbi:MAG: hypothetical protein L3K01_04435 [Thermoplasmata archaeon]|nr:hypothetical protein [Thermoplasmata archaeon]